MRHAVKVVPSCSTLMAPSHVTGPAADRSMLSILALIPGPPARVAYAVKALPFENALVEIEMIAACD